MVGKWCRAAACLSALVVCAPAAPPQRIVSTAPSITEMLFALGLGDRVVAVTTFCRYPPEAAAKPKIGDYLRPNLEAILALRPDLVLVEKSMIRRSLALPAFRGNVVEVDDTDLEGVLASIRRIGEACGVPGRAQQLIQQIRWELDQVRRRTAFLPRRRVLLVVGRTPGRIEDLIAAGRHSYLHELLEIAGGANIVADASAAYVKVSLEEVLARNPEIIVDFGDMSQAVPSPDRGRAVARLWSRYPNLAAVKTGRVYGVAADPFVVPGPRVAQAARRLAALLHPEAGF
ncbi:MAG TPA: helical backbone metal receptor [Bryobacteraceae bacterium]|nr:helical backbone metal receptor [Bryobacteraceae bacterium]